MTSNSNSPLIIEVVIVAVVVIIIIISSSSSSSSSSGNIFWVYAMRLHCDEFLSYVKLFLQFLIALPHQKQNLELRQDLGLEMNTELVIFFKKIFILFILFLALLGLHCCAGFL